MSFPVLFCRTCCFPVFIYSKNLCFQRFCRLLFTVRNLPDRKFCMTQL